jgi:hypothetical protein
MKTFVNNLQKIRKGRRKMGIAPHCKQRKEEKKEAQCRSIKKLKKAVEERLKFFQL